MREIKFRAWCRDGDWDEEGENREFEMISAENLSFSEYKPVAEQLTDIDDQIYFMQFTGLKDKNGTEIYEGDIVEFEITSIETKEKSKTIHEITFGLSGDSQRFTGFGYYYPKEDYFCLFHEGDSDRVEVIGNIYQNKELLESEKENQTTVL